MQGDLEREHDKPISFLCDRNTVNVARAQPGFANHIVIPFWSLITEVCPEMDICLERVRENVGFWENFEETELEKLVYSAEDSAKSYYKTILGTNDQDRRQSLQSIGLESHIQAA